MRGLLFIITFLSGFFSSAQFRVRVEITDYPLSFNRNEFYIAGSFNEWKPGDKYFRLLSMPTGVWYIDMELVPGLYEYKITGGDWEKVECAKDGRQVENRVLKVESDTVVRLSIQAWADQFAVSSPRVSTASRNVHVVDTAFYIPELKRYRKIGIYLPENYASNLSVKYPVLYMQDGKNLFDQLTSYAGEWGVDEFLDSTQLPPCIVVSIDNGDNRMTEYNPYDHERFGKGEGDAYIHFIAKTLKPYIDKRYRTLRGRQHTVIAGSSMGGLISLYAVLKYPGVFGGAGVFSPSLWITENKIYGYIKKRGKKSKARIYFYAGKMESTDMVPHMLKAFEMMNRLSRYPMTAIIRDEGKHNEARWRVEFPLFYKWVF